MQSLILGTILQAKILRLGSTGGHCSRQPPLFLMSKINKTIFLKNILKRNLPYLCSKITLSSNWRFLNDQISTFNENSDNSST